MPSLLAPSSTHDMSPARGLRPATGTSEQRRWTLRAARVDDRRQLADTEWTGISVEIGQVMSIIHAPPTGVCLAPGGEQASESAG
nr:hypothetical protein CFP56_08057 [Quercus suber]